MWVLLRRKKILAGIIALVVLGSGVAAYAFWTNGGTGSGTAATGTNTGITVNQTSAPAGLYPGGDAQSLSGDFDNTNAGSVQVHNVTATLASVTGGGTDGTKPDCTIADYTLTDNPATVDAEIPTGTAQGAWGPISIAMVDSGTNQDNCKNATVHVNYTSD